MCGQRRTGRVSDAEATPLTASMLWWPPRLLPPRLPTIPTVIAPGHSLVVGPGCLLLNIRFLKKFLQIQILPATAITVF